MENFIIILFSIIGTFLIIRRLARKENEDQLKHMREDGLSDKQIIDICGKEWFERTNK